MVNKILGAKDFAIRESDELCERCGRTLKYGQVWKPGSDKPTEIRIMCECESREEAERKSRAIAEGRRIIRQSMLKASGMLARQQSQTFAGFAPTQKQKAAYSAARSFSADKGTGLVICGGVGSGKTHLAAAIAHDIIDRYEIDDEWALDAAKESKTGGYIGGFSPVYFISSTELMSSLRAAMNKGEHSPAMQRCKSAQVLILDDLGAEKPSDWTVERIFEIIDHRYSSCRPTVITTNCTADELKRQIGTRSYDRIKETCRYVTITETSRRQATLASEFRAAQAGCE